MKTFWIRMMAVAMIVLLIGGYDMVIDAREKDDQIAQMNAQISQMEQQAELNAESGAGGGNYQDGTYSGEADGFGGTVGVEVKIEDGAITQIEVVSAEHEDGAYLDMAKDIIPAIIEAQTAEVDTISGATFSSTGIKNATEQALESASEK
jgi:uncharacterized protein with FMN-binding domain